MRDLVNTNPQCTKCLASLHVSLLNQGINLDLLEQFIHDSLVSQDKRILELSAKSDFNYLLKERQKLVTAQLLLSLIKRSKTLS
jgi:hypothetical protein